MPFRTELLALMTLGALSHLAGKDGKKDPKEFDSLSILGAWGLGLFQSDHDYELIDELDRALNIVPLEQAEARKPSNMEAFRASPLSKGSPVKIKVKRVQLGNGMHLLAPEQNKNICYMTTEKTNEGIRALHKLATQWRGSDAGGEAFIHFSVYGPLCSDVSATRKHLDSGALVELLEQLTTKYEVTKSGETKNLGYDRSGYELVLLTACAMSLGCQIPNKFMDNVKTLLHSVGLKRDAITQMELALGDEGYKAGTPYSFGSLSLYETLQAGGAPQADRIFDSPELINVEWPSEPKARFLRDLVWDTNQKMDQQEGGVDGQASGGQKARVGAANSATCASCGAEEGEDGTDLRRCGRCGTVLYCGRKCWKKDWEGHKKACKKASK